ncbi:MAG: AMP-binding protein, partial [Holophagales bacterium]|nr:AMP-binding protein [Holophagales bacterium]
MLAKGLEVPVAFYGVMATGGVLVPIDPGSPVPQIVRILRAVGAAALVTSPARATAAREALQRAPDVKLVMGLAADVPGERATYRRLPWARVDEAARRAGGRPPDVQTLALDPSYVLHTSGSTGEPKLIRHTHASASSFVDWAVEEYDLGPGDRLSQHSSHHTCFATFAFYAAARAGATTVILPPAALKMPGSLSASIEGERISVWYSVPTALVQLSLRGGLEERDLSALRWVLFAGETFPVKHLHRLRRQLPRARFSHVYGSTEVNVCTYYHLPAGGELASPLPIGRPCSNAEAVVVDADLETVADGEAGELLVRGSTVMSGYWDDAERNARAFVRRDAA